jgi:RNA polymerase sigma-70 factor (ECF subfamily)
VDLVAFEELLRPEYRTAYRLAYAMLHNSSEAEDAVQEAALRAWRRIGNLHEEREFRHWFLAIVANQCRTVTRGRWWSVVRLPAPGDRMPAASPDQTAAMHLRSELRLLSHDQRLLLVLRYYLDLPFEEVAMTLGISVKAARSRTDRALARLRVRMNRPEVLA